MSILNAATLWVRTRFGLGDPDPDSAPTEPIAPARICMPPAPTYDPDEDITEQLPPGRVVATDAWRTTPARVDLTRAPALPEAYPDLHELEETERYDPWDDDDITSALIEIDVGPVHSEW